MPDSEKSRRTRILVLDMSPVGEKYAVVNRIFSFSGTDADSTVQEVRTKLLELRKCLPDSDDVAPLAETVLTLLHKYTSHLTKHSSNRWIGTKGDSIQVYLLRVSGRPGRIDIAEVPRESRISSDLVTFAQLALKTATTPVALTNGARPREYSYTFREYYLTKTRATLKVTGTFVPPDTPKLKKDSAKTEEADTLITSLITGPRESFFLSANVAAYTKARQVKYDETERVLKVEGTPSVFLVGLNYTRGDLFEDQRQGWLRRFLEGIYGGVLVEASSKPLDQVCAIVGFRHVPPWFDRFLSFESASPYVGVVWARNYKSDTASDTVAHRVDTDYARKEIIAGVSVNLEKALKWIGGS